MVALTTTTIAVIGLSVILLGWVVYGIFNVVGGRKEVGSELELAANRKPYYDDETLEGPRLERVQFYGVLLLLVIVIGLLFGHVTKASWYVEHIMPLFDPTAGVED